MEEFDHFSHDQPLTTLYVDYKEVDDDGEDPKPYLCSMCGLPILFSPPYTCSINGCEFFLHRPCAQLPKRLESPKYHPAKARIPHTLSLKSNGESSQNFTYKCEDCRFNLHPLVAGEVQIKIKHKSHQSHLLVAMRRETCGEKQNGFFFTCRECHFWIHPDCTLLSSYLKIASHPHPLNSLLVSFSTLDVPSSEYECVICKREELMNAGIYCCSVCHSYAHVSCAKLNADNIKIGLMIIE